MSQKIAISEFKSHCLEILKNLEKTKAAIIVTKRDKPVATISPIIEKGETLFDALKDKGEIKGDIISNIEDRWEAAR